MDNSAMTLNLENYRTRLNGWRIIEKERNEMFNDLLSKYEELRTRLRVKNDDYENEVDARRNWQAKAQNALRAAVSRPASHPVPGFDAFPYPYLPSDIQDLLSLRVFITLIWLQILSLLSLLPIPHPQVLPSHCCPGLEANGRRQDASPFVFAVIDGDGAIFRDDLLAEGAEGGAKAAYALKSEIKQHLKQLYPDSATDDWEIIVQVVLHQDGLARAIQNSHQVRGFSAQSFHAFTREFRRTESLFDFTDVGSGKERADHRIRDLFKLYAKIPQCKHVFFGPCHDNGYASFFAPYKPDPAVGQRITLIETTPAEPSFVSLGFRRVHFPSVFREEALPAAPAPAPTPALQPPPGLAPVPVPSASAKTLVSSPPGPTPSASSLVSPSKTDTSAFGSWATVGSLKPKAASRVINIATSSPPGGNKRLQPAGNTDPRGKFFLQNASKDRLDIALPRTDAQAERRFNDRMDKYGKACNNYFLSSPNYCPAGERCDFAHAPKMEPGEVLVLKHKARSLHCSRGLGCEDVNCNLGHVCRNGQGCGNPHCRFSDTHYVDTVSFPLCNVIHAAPNGCVEDWTRVCANFLYSVRVIRSMKMVAGSLIKNRFLVEAPRSEDLWISGWAPRLLWWPRDEVDSCPSYQGLTVGQTRLSRWPVSQLLV